MFRMSPLHIVFNLVHFEKKLRIVFEDVKKNILYNIIIAVITLLGCLIAASGQRSQRVMARPCCCLASDSPT